MASLENSTVERARREEMERWRAHTERWDAEVAESENRAWDATKIAAEFGKLGLQSAILLNGGALVAIPPLMQWLNDIGRTKVVPIASWFFIGLLCAAVSVVFAYINFSALAQANYGYARRRAIELDAQYADKPFADDPLHRAADRSTVTFGWVAVVTAWVALIFAVGSFGGFSVGVFRFIDLASNPVLPANVHHHVAPAPPKH
jgi:hypothetical protein